MFFLKKERRLRSWKMVQPAKTKIWRTASQKTRREVLSLVRRKRDSRVRW